MGMAQVIYIFLSLIALGVAISEHGTHKIGYNNFWKTLCACGLEFALLWWGGFFG